MLTKGGLTARFKGVTGIEIAISYRKSERFADYLAMFQQRFRATRCDSNSQQLHNRLAMGNQRSRAAARVGSPLLGVDAEMPIDGRQ